MRSGFDFRHIKLPGNKTGRMGGQYIYSGKACSAHSFYCNRSFLCFCRAVPAILGYRGGGSGHVVFLALWPLQGFEIVPLPAGETDRPQRAVPIATIGSLLCVTLIYVLVQTVCVGVFAGLSGATERPLADAAAIFSGPAGATVIALGAVISMIGYTAGNALGSPRFLSALAEDKCLPHRLSAPHPRFLTHRAQFCSPPALHFVRRYCLAFSSWSY